ncbi:MAG: hypothetical protein R3314_07020, partial [Longimicrobiales bacterium]|nr:hypothetical protein [Longimicrobiales bacterium]
FLWASRRPLLLAVAMLAVLVLAGEPWNHDPKMRLISAWPMWLVVVPLIWGFAVFHNEGPDNRLYFWSMPTDRSGQTLARLAAGLTWLWVSYIGLIVAGWLFGLMDGNAWQLAEIGVAGWVNFFTGPLLVYLSISLLTVPSNYPIRWFFGILFVIPLFISLFVDWIAELEDVLETVFAPLINEDWGFFVTMIGGWLKDLDRLEVTLQNMMDPGATTISAFDAARYWWAATPLWIIVMAAVVTFVATRHPDALPRWRGLRRGGS